MVSLSLASLKTKSLDAVQGAHQVRSAQTRDRSPAAESLSSRVESDACSVSKGRGRRALAVWDVVTRRVFPPTGAPGKGAAESLRAVVMLPPCRKVRGRTAKASEKERQRDADKDGSMRPDTSDAQGDAAGGGRGMMARIS